MSECLRHLRLIRRTEEMLAICDDHLAPAYERMAERHRRELLDTLASEIMLRPRRVAKPTTAFGQMTRNGEEALSPPRMALLSLYGRAA